jgi:hypothetical protein
MDILFADRLSVPANSRIALVEVPMDSGNALQLSVVVHNLGGASGLSLQVQEGNDRMNFTTTQTFNNLLLGSTFPAVVSGIASAWVRVVALGAASGTIVCSIEGEIAKL